MMQTIKGTASRNVIFGGITYVLAEDIYYDAKDWAPIEPRAQVKSPEGAEIYCFQMPTVSPRGLIPTI